MSLVFDNLFLNLLLFLAQTNSLIKNSSSIVVKSKAKLKITTYRV